VLFRSGNVAECTGDNIFIVKDGRVVTSPVEAGILVGITRQSVIDLARKAKLPLAEEDFDPEARYAADECFLTGTAAEIIAVTHVDGRPIGAGTPGPITGQLTEAFRKFANSL
jgi:branched-chain amino acid aminotransferase